jgi:hypothetical protein
MKMILPFLQNSKRELSEVGIASFSLFASFLRHFNKSASSEKIVDFEVDLHDLF